MTSTDTAVTSEPAHEQMQLVQAYFDAGEALDVARIAAFFAEDALFELPFAPAGFPGRHEGREAIAAFLQQFPKYYRRIRLLDRRITPLGDGSGVVAEYRGEWENLKGRPYNNTYIALIRIREGRIVHMREFFNPLVWLESVQRPAVAPTTE